MRKSRVKGGDQHAISVRIDKYIWERWLQTEENKNRLINECLDFYYWMRHEPAGSMKILNGTQFMKMTKEIWE